MVQLMSEITREKWDSCTGRGQFVIVQKLVDTLNEAVNAANRQDAKIKELDALNFDLYRTIGDMLETQEGENISIIDTKPLTQD